MTRRSLVLPLLLLAFGSGAAHAAGANEAAWGEPRSVRVRVDDLRLDHPSGPATLHRRIESAVAQVCDLPSAHRLEQRQRVLACVRSTREVAYREAARLAGIKARLAQAD